MKFVITPNIEDAWDNVRINTLSPSMFSWVNSGCSYQVLLQKALDSFNDKSFFLPPPKNTIIGTIVHKIYELSSKRALDSIADLSNQWEKLIKEKEKELKGLYPTLQNVDINDYDKRNKCFRYALSLMKSVNQYDANNYMTYSEYWLDCSEIGLRGIIDKLYITSNGIEIVDYKSGAVVDEKGMVKEEYVVQLQLYAIMCEHLKMGRINTLALVDIDGKKHEIDYDYLQKDNYISKVRKTIDLLNQVIKDRAFERVVRHNGFSCSICSVRHICEKKEQPIDSNYITITGTVSDVISSNLFEINDVSDNKLYVSGLGVYEIDTPEQYLNKKLSFVNIVRSNDEHSSNCYKTINNTLVYELS